MTLNVFFFISDEFLIEAVKLKPELYDLSSPYYSDTVAKRRIWTEIGQNCLFIFLLSFSSSSKATAITIKSEVEKSHILHQQLLERN